MHSTRRHTTRKAYNRWNYGVASVLHVYWRSAFKEGLVPLLDVPTSNDRAYTPSHVAQANWSALVTTIKVDLESLPGLRTMRKRLSEPLSLGRLHLRCGQVN